MRILVAGDFHGPKGLEHANRMAQARGCDLILQVGDFWAYDTKPVTPTRFIPGNHEKWDRILRRDFAPNVELLEDYSVHEFGSLRFGCLGRIQNSEAHVGLMARGWWLGEDPHIWLAEDEKAAEGLAGSDVLVFHDQPHFELADEDFLCRLVRAVRPRLVLHGHMHRYRVTRPLEGVTVVSLPPCDPTDVVIVDEEGRTSGPHDDTFVLDTEKRTLWHVDHGTVEW